MNRLLPLLLLALSPQTWAVFPSFEDTNSNTDDSDVTTHTIDMPATCTTGNLAVAVFATDADPTITWDEAGWTQLGTKLGPGSGVNGQIRVKVATGSDAGDSFTISTAVVQQSASFTVCVQDWEGTLAGVEVGTVATGTSTNPDPPSVSPSWGSDDTLWIPVCASDSFDTTTVYSYPDNQTNINGANATGASVSISSDELTGTSQNPGAYTLSGSEEWGCNTIAVEPAAAGTTVAPLAYQYYEGLSQ